MPEKITHVDTLATQVTDALRKDIICKNFEAESKITIKQISELYGVSHMPVREAFRTLEGEGLITILPHKGAQVRNIDIDFVRDTYEINKCLETLMFENAMDKLTEDILAELREINAKIKYLKDEDNDLMQYLELNNQLHELILKHNHNKKAYELFKYQSSIIKSLRSAYTPSFARVQEAYCQHEKILDALAAKNRTALRDATEEHVSSAMKNFINQLTGN